MQIYKTMRIILTIAAIFSWATLLAQPQLPTENREPARGVIMPYATAAEADAAPEKHRFVAPVSAWEANDNRLVGAFTAPFAWTNRQAVLRIEAASAPYEVWVNGRLVGSTNDPATPADFLITKQTKEGWNSVELRLESPSSVAPISGWVTDSTPWAGAARVISSPTMGVREVLTKCWFSPEDPATANAEVGVVVKSYALNNRSVRIYYTLDDPAGRTVAQGQSDLTLSMRGEDTVRFLARVSDTLLWSRERPQHFTLRIKTQRDGRYMEYHTYPIGLRSVEVKEGKLLINNRPETLQAVPMAADATVQMVADVKRMGINAIRLKAGNHNEALLTACDTLGVYVIAQAPINSSKSGSSRLKGGNPSNNPRWKGAYRERAEASYHTSKRHPSVVGFSIAEQSSNGICLYESYLHLKKQESMRPILYPEAEGEWNNDPIEWNIR